MLALQSSKWGKKCSIFQIPKYSTFDLGKDLKILLERLKGIILEGAPGSPRDDNKHSH